MTTTRTGICNVAQMSLGQESIADIDDTTDPVAVKLKSVFDVRLADLISRDWVFTRERAELTPVYKLTVDTAPAPTAWVVDATLTGASGTTCTVKKVISTTVYWVTEPVDSNGDAADFTDGEIISDGTNSVNCATDYPEIDTTPPEFGSWDYCYAIPSDYACNLKLVDEYNDDIIYPFNREGFVFFANVTTAYAKYNKTMTDVSIMPGWFTNLLAKDLANTLAPKFVGNDTYVALRAKKNLAEAWMDAYSGNGGDSYFENAGGEAEGNTDTYEGFRNSAL